MHRQGVGKWSQGSAGASLGDTPVKEATGGLEVLGPHEPVAEIHPQEQGHVDALDHRPPLCQEAFRSLGLPQDDEALSVARGRKTRR